MDDLVVLAGVPSTYTLDELIAKVPEAFRTGVTKVLVLFDCAWKGGVGWRSLRYIVNFLLEFLM